MPGDVADAGVARRSRGSRRAFLIFVAVVVLLGATGLLGVRTGSVSMSAEGYTLTVTYASMTRPGLATPFGIEVANEAGFGSGFELRTSSSFLEAFDENGLDPEPVTSMSDGTWTTWGFERPTATTFRLSFDARLEPAVQWRRSGETRLVVDGKVVAQVAYTMWVMP